MEHFMNPRNVGEIPDADGIGEEGNPVCGDMMTFYIKVDNDRLSDVKFKTFGCGAAIAVSSMVSEMAKGKTLEEAKKITWKQASEALGGLPPIKTHCSVLAVDGLQAAIQNYEERHGLVKEHEPTTVEVVRKRLKRVMNPVVGLALVRTNLVEDIEVADGKVRVVVDLPADHQFANNIREEIVEKIEPLWDVDEVIVQFVG